MYYIVLKLNEMETLKVVVERHLGGSHCAPPPSVHTFAELLPRMSLAWPCDQLYNTSRVQGKLRDQHNRNIM